MFTYKDIADHAKHLGLKPETIRKKLGAFNKAKIEEGKPEEQVLPDEVEVTATEHFYDPTSMPRILNALEAMSFRKRGRPRKPGK